MKEIKIKSDLKNEISSKSKLNKLRSNAFYYICVILLIYIYFSFFLNQKIIPKIIENNFFIIDSNNLEKIRSIMYGFSISEKGLLTNNYYKKLRFL